MYNSYLEYETPLEKKSSQGRSFVISNPGIPGEKSLHEGTDFSTDTRRNDNCPKVEMTLAGFVITSIFPFKLGKHSR
jgi:hypothetical protein